MFSSSFLNGALFPQRSMCQFRSKSSSLFYWSVLIGTVLANELCFYSSLHTNFGSCKWDGRLTWDFETKESSFNWLEILRHKKIVLLIQMRYNILQMSVNYCSGQIDIDNMSKIKRRLSTYDTNCYQQQRMWWRCPDAS